MKASLKLPASLWERLVRLAQSQSVPASELLSDAIMALPESGGELVLHLGRHTAKVSDAAKAKIRLLRSRFRGVSETRVIETAVRAYLEARPAAGGTSPVALTPEEEQADG